METLNQILAIRFSSKAIICRVSLLTDVLKIWLCVYWNKKKKILVFFRTTLWTKQTQKLKYLLALRSWCLSEYTDTITHVAEDQQKPSQNTTYKWSRKINRGKDLLQNHDQHQCMHIYVHATHGIILLLLLICPVTLLRVKVVVWEGARRQGSERKNAGKKWSQLPGQETSKGINLDMGCDIEKSGSINIAPNSCKSS